MTYAVFEVIKSDDDHSYLNVCNLACKSVMTLSKFIHVA